MVTTHHLLLYLLLRTKSPRKSIRTRDITDASDESVIDNWYRWRNSILKRIQRMEVRDSLEPWSNSSEAQRAFQRYFQMDFQSSEWILCNRHSMRVAAMTLAERCMHLAKFGLGAHLVRDVGNGFQIDLKYMYNYDVRPGFLPYGCLVRYTYAFVVMDIEIRTQGGTRVLTVGEKDFIVAYNIFCSSLFTHTFLVDNILFCHRFAAKNMHTLISKHSDALNPHFRRFVSIFLIGTPSILEDVERIFLNPGGIASRLFAFTPSAFRIFLRETANNFTYENMYSCLRQKVRIRIPFLHDARAYNESVNDFVSNLLDDMQKDSNRLLTPVEFDHDMMDIYSSSLDRNETPEDILKFVIARHIFTVTFWREHVGNYLWYTSYPGTIKSKIHESQSYNFNDTKENMLLSALWECVSTRKNLPRISDDIEMCMKKYMHHIVFWRYTVKNITYKCERMENANYVTSV